MHTSYSQKKTLEVTLSLEVYDDFDHRDVDFRDLLQLEGDETVTVSVTDYSEFEVIWISIQYDCMILIIIMNIMLILIHINM